MPQSSGSQAPAQLFVSYRRAQTAAVDKLCSLLTSHGVSVWLDRNDVNELDEFPERTLQGLASSHAVLIWWSLDYAESRFCLEEFRLAWTMARGHPASEGKRIWILNPEDPRHSARHILAGDLGAYSYLEPPEPESATAWAQSRGADLLALARFGPLCEKPVRSIYPAWYGRPARGRPIVGRGNELWRVHSAMFPQWIGGSFAPPMVHLHGIPGVGKSALAGHYAETFAAAYPGGVWWFNLAARGEICSVEEAGLAWLWALEQALGLFNPGLLAELSRDSDGRALSPPLVRDRLARHLTAGEVPYLWVLERLPLIEDGDVREQSVAFLRAPTAAGRTLLTSRDSMPLAEAVALSLPPLPASDGEALLGGHLAPVQREKQRKIIAELVAEVGGHPLALILLGRRVAHSSSGFAPVLEEVRRSSALESLERTWSLFRKELGKLAPSVVAAIQVSLEAPLDDDARRLLALAGVCSTHAPVPMPLLTQAFRHVDVAFDPAELDTLSIRFDLAVRALVRASLMDLDATDRQHATVHPLVSAVMIKSLKRTPKPERRAIGEALLSRLAPLGVDSRAFLAVRTDAPHVLAILASQESAQDPDIARRDVVLLALGLSRLQDGIGLPGHALAAARQAASLAAQYLHSDDPDHLRARTALAAATASAGLLTEAASLQEVLLPEAERIFGDTHEDALVLRSLLAGTRYEQGRLKDAEQLQAALIDTLRGLPEIRAKALPPVLLSLAATLQRQHRLAEARSVAEQARDLILADEAIHGPHPDGVIALHNIAAIRLAMGDIDVARELETQVVQKAEQLFGPDHPRTRLARSTLADALVSCGSPGLAIPLYQQALEQAATVLGDEHPECLVTMSRLIAAHLTIDAHLQAQELQVRFIAAASAVLPAGHPDALAAVKNLASQLRCMGLPIGQLAPLLEELVKARLRERGVNHDDTRHALDDFLVARSQAGAVGETLELRLAALGAARALQEDPTHRIVALLVAHHELITLLRELGHHDAAVQAEIEAISDLRALRQSRPAA